MTYLERMTHGRGVRGIARWLKLALLAGVFAAACSDASGGSPNAGSNTNWLRTCDTTDQCGGGLECVCGVCTVACVSDASCAGHDEKAMCVETDDAKLAGVCTADDADQALRICVRTCASDADCEGEETCEERVCTGKPAKPLDLVGGNGGSGGHAGSGGSAGGGGDGGAADGGVPPGDGGGAGTGAVADGCSVTLDDPGAACAGANCPVTLSAYVDCEADVFDLRAAAASTERGYVSFYHQAPATSRGYAMFAVLDPGGGSAVEQLPDEVGRWPDVAADGAGEPVVFGVTATGIARYDGGIGNWSRTTVAGDTDARQALDAAISGAGDAYVLHAADGVPLMLASDTGGGWTERQIAGPRPGIASLGLAYWDAFALGLAPDGTPHVVYWERGASEGRLEHVAGTGTPETLGTRALSDHASALRVLAPASEPAPIAGLVDNQEIHLLVPDGASGQTTLTLAPVVSVKPTGCMEKTQSGDCPADTTYTETSDGVQGTGFALARTLDGTPWLAYAERHVECDYLRTQEVSESGPQCISRVVDDRSRTEIVVAEITIGASAAITERFRGPIDAADATEFAADASGSRLHVAAALFRSTVIGNSARGGVRYLVIDTGRF